MTHKYALSLVKYWNTRPLLYGLQHSALAASLDIQLDVPSAGAQKLIEDRVDAGLFPVAVMAHVPGVQLITHYCIGAHGKVKSVCIFSEKPLEQVGTLYLDDHSVTSVQLARILLREYWKINPRLFPATPGYIEKIGGTTAGLVIGDRAIALGNKLPFIYDLAEAWQSLTGLPFVFAAWMTRHALPADFLADLNDALQYGVSHIDALAEEPTPLFTRAELKDYLQHNISFSFDEAKHEALALFLRKLKALPPWQAI